MNCKSELISLRIYHFKEDKQEKEKEEEEEEEEEDKAKPVA